MLYPNKMLWTAVLGNQNVFLVKTLMGKEHMKSFSEMVPCNVRVQISYVSEPCL